MNTQEATEIVGTVLANWPDPPVTDLVTEAWLERIMPLDYVKARDAVKQLVGERAWRPTAEEVAVLARRGGATILEFKARGPVPGALPPEAGKSKIAQLRAELRGNRTGEQP